MDPTGPRSTPQSDRARVLIGPAVFPAYLRVMRVLAFTILPIVGIGVGVATIISGAGPWQVLSAAANAAVAVAINLAFWVTLVFAIIDRRGGAPATWAVDEKPIRPQSRGVSLGEVIGSTVGLALLAGFLFWQPGYQVSWAPGEPSTPILDPALARFWIPMILVVIAASIALLIAVYLHGRWTMAFAAVNTVLNLAFAVPVIWLIVTDQVLNPAFVEAVSIPGVTAPAFVPTLITWIIGGVAVLDTAQSWWKALQHSTSSLPSTMGTWTPSHP